MVPRRQFLHSGALGGLVGLLEPPDADAAGAPQAADSASLENIAAQINRLRMDLDASRTFPEIGPIRDAQKTFLRANGKFPNFVEVGLDLWFTIMLLQTAVILRGDASATFVGLPYDV